MSGLRTVISVLILAAMTLFAFWLSAHMPDGLAMHLFDTLAWTFFGMALVLAGKSGVEKLAGGGGVRGAIAALMTSTKPEDPVQQPASQAPSSETQQPAKSS
jgi:hypothetical protein